MERYDCNMHLSAVTLWPGDGDSSCCLTHPVITQSDGFTGNVCVEINLHIYSNLTFLQGRCGGCFIIAGGLLKPV